MKHRAARHGQVSPIKKTLGDQGALISLGISTQYQALHALDKGGLQPETVGLIRRVYGSSPQVRKAARETVLGNQSS